MAKGEICNHSCAEQDVACTADGMCPLCMADELERLQENIDGLDAMEEEVRRQRKEIDRLRGMIEDKHGPFLDANPLLVEQCRELGEKLTQLVGACRRFIDSVEDGQERYDDLCMVVRETEEEDAPDSAPTSAPKKRREGDDGG